jgi:nucleotide-binding universal stress UspA family protein
MLTLLVPVDGSESSHRAVEHAIEFSNNSKAAVEVHLLNVQLPIVSGEVRMFVSPEAIQSYYQEQGGEAVRDARSLFEAAGRVYVSAIRVGPIAETIIGYGKETRCSQVIMGTRGLGAVSGLFLGSVATKVIHLANVPVTLIK